LSTPRPRRRPRWLLALAGVVALLVVFGLGYLLATALAPAPAPAVAATPSPAPSPAPSPSASAEPATAQAEHQEYRAYVSSLIEGGAAVVAGLGGLAGCRSSRDECVTRLGEASDKVGSMQHSLDANPAPSCLNVADGRIQDALSFQQKGLALARDGVKAENRVQLAQGALMVAAGVWRAGQAVIDVRQSSC